MRQVFLLLAFGACATTDVLTAKGLDRASPGITERAGAPRRFALLVGIDRFDDGHFTPLRFAARDARELGSALTGYQTVRVLTAPDETLKASILAEFDAIAREATNPQDTVVVYLSSHGTLGRRPGGPLERVIVTRDTRLELLADTGLLVDRLKALLERVPARRKALVLALCHSGKGKSALDDSLAAQLSATKSAPIALHEVSEGLLVLTACAFGETARESEALGHDIYTAGLLTALERGDRDGDGAVTALEAHDFAREVTFATTNGEQRPTAEVELVGKDPVVLAGDVVRTSAPVLFSYAPASDGLRVRVDGAVKGLLPGGVTLEPGRREVLIEDARSGAVLASTTLTLSSGDRFDVSEVLPPPPAWHAALGARAMAVIDETVRRRALPLSAGPSFTLEREGGGMSFGGALAYLTGAGTLDGIDEQLPFRAHLIEPSARWRWTPWHRVGISFGAEVSWLITLRDAAVREFRSVQVVGGPMVAARLGWERRFLREFGLSIHLRAGALAIGLEGATRAAPFAGLDLELGWHPR